MAATPKTGTLFFRGASTQRVYAVNAYFSDVANGLVKWNANGTAGSGSSDSWRAPSNEDVVLYDFAMTTGTADTTNISMQTDQGTVPASILPYAVYLNTINTRPQIGLRFARGSLIGAIQNA